MFTVTLYLSSPSIASDVKWGTCDDSLESDCLSIWISYSCDPTSARSLSFPFKRPEWVSFSRTATLNTSERKEKLVIKPDSCESLLQASEAIMSNILEVNTKFP